MSFRDEVLANLSGPGARAYVADNFAKYAKVGSLARFLVRYELMKKILDVKGGICECGVQTGVGLLGFWQLSRLLEPHQRRRVVIGFDTFTGFPSISEKDGPEKEVGDLSVGENTYHDIINCIIMHDHDELVMTSGMDNISEITKPRVKYPPRIAVFKGDFMTTGAEFIEKNPCALFALVYLDFDLYEPTKKAIELFLPRMPKGAIFAFDELNNAGWPGETLAVMETLGIRNLELKQFPFDLDVCYAVM